MSEQIRQDLEATYTYLEAKGWCQRTGMERDGRVCLEGALAYVTMGEVSMWGATKMHSRRHCLALSALRNSLNLEPDPFCSINYQLWDGISLWKWNDQPGRTVQDVKDLIRKTIKDLQEVEA